MKHELIKVNINVDIMVGEDAYFLYETLIEPSRLSFNSVFTQRKNYYEYYCNDVYVPSYLLTLGMLQTLSANFRVIVSSDLIIIEEY